MSASYGIIMLSHRTAGGGTTRNAYIPDEHYRKIRECLRPEYRYLVDLLRLTGFRVDDLLSTRNYQWSGAEIALRERKTGNTRRIQITPVITLSLSRYRRAHSGRRELNQLAFTFQAVRHGEGMRHKLHRSTIYRAWETAIKDAGLEGRGYTIHSLRKCYAVDLLKRTGSVEAVQRDLGHKYLSTTLLYIYGIISHQISESGKK